MLDIDATDNKSKDGAKAIVHSLKKLFPDHEIKLSGITTDSGGGITLESVGEELDELGVCDDDFLVLLCALHNL